MASVQSQLVVFDFDWSLADQDTDRWILEVLDIELRRKMRTMESEGVEWTDVVAQTMKELHARGGTREQVEEALRIMPFHPAMVRGVKRLKHQSTPKTTFLCLSASNTVYISTILKARGLEELFDVIVTNPAKWSDDGCLELERRVAKGGPPHNCPNGCGPNMCKGAELDAYLERTGQKFDRMAYVGDGSNDFCPILRFRKQDVALVRKGRALETRVKHEAEKYGLKCQVKYWAGAWEVEEIFNAF
ncbi:hypothetical protein BOTBODRAFT_26130 [Botryobasidium botryosum FD-172 SS1]|uniref:Phosphatase phospho-type n=1 Tax=Botryobasidium botryosum (strain FD-172 SS1) TaxID=930990 RepID=A0A067N120_BOTB1|nr:hypothetical protein BOTBODRAFT_26130 [Botryobasidium botryosum FD-172 SS1]